MLIWHQKATNLAGPRRQAVASPPRRTARHWKRFGHPLALFFNFFYQCTGSRPPLAWLGLKLCGLQCLRPSRRAAAPRSLIALASVQPFPSENWRSCDSCRLLAWKSDGRCGQVSRAALPARVAELDGQLNDRTKSPPRPRCPGDGEESDAISPAGKRVSRSAAWAASQAVER